MRFFKNLMFVAAAVCVVGVSANGVRVDFDDVMQKAVKEQGDDKTIVDLLKPKRFQEFIVFKLDSMGASTVSGIMSTKELGKTHIMFPEDGHQPTTEEAGEYSGARITDENESKKVTSWYMYAFGGKEVEEYMGDDLPKISQKNAVYPSFGINGRNIITVGDSETPDKKKLKNVFWSRFKKIASDPVGRVLLYRLLIEIRRSQDGNGAFEYIRDETNLTVRNGLRSIEIIPSQGGCFCANRGYIGVVPRSYTSQPTVVAMIEKKIPTMHIEIKSGKNTKLTWEVSTISTAGEDTDYPKDISLFHEMLHWFHYLRAADRFTKENTAMSVPYGYPFDCYYGRKLEKGQHSKEDDIRKQREALFLWFYPGRGYEGEEVRTILGIPSTKKDELRSLMPAYARGERSDREKFLNGDDLSENAYRLSRSGNGLTYKMRFGHTSDTIDGFDATMRGGTIRKNGLDQNAFKLAHAVAMSCYKDITGTEKKGWNLVPGEAAENLTE